MPKDRMKQALIALAVNDLAREREFDSITVDMICERAHISRSGFYRTFQDKYAVLTWCEAFPLERGLGEMGRTLTIAQGVEAALQGFELFWDMFTSTGRSTERKRREDNGIHRTHRLICETVTEYHGIALDPDLDYQALWSARGTLLAIREESGLPSGNASELAHRIACCYPTRLAAILDAPVNPTAPESLDFKSLVM